jgi:hypothetical protein
LLLSPCLKELGRNHLQVVDPATSEGERTLARASEAPLWPRSTAFALAAGVLVFGLAVKLYTGHVWEDFLITFRFSENLVKGNGLVYEPGEKVFGFTSPLDGLLPALFKAVLGGPEYFRALWAFASVSLVVMGAGIVAYGKLVGNAPPKQARAELCVLTLVLLLNVKVVMNAINGQEAGLWAGFILMSFCALLKHDAGWKGLGLAAGCLLWTRPDSPIQIGLLAIGALLFSDEPRRELLKRMAKAAALAAAVYLPWFAWATWYYGSPMPHTITAKINMFGGVPGLVPKLVQFGRVLPEAVAHAFEPIYSSVGGWPNWVGIFGLVLGSWCALYWVFPGRDRVARIASFFYFGSALYLGCVGVSGLIFPWYYVPCCVSGAVVISRVVGASLDSSRRRPAALVALGIITVGLGYQMVFSCMQLKLRQVLVENGTRRHVGLWLHDHMQKGQTVYLEPIGYIGYYSGAHILDYPGLVSPSVVAARRLTNQGFYGCIGVLKPDWLVMRPRDLPVLGQIPELRRRYVVAWAYDAGINSGRFDDLPGSGFLAADSHMIVLRRTSDDIPTVPPR